MTLKRLILIVLTVVSLIPVFFSLGGSLSQPQVQARLQLYQTNLVLQASEFVPGQPADLSAARDALIGSDPYSTAQEQYQEALEVAQKGRSSLQAQLQQLAGVEKNTAPLERKTVPIVEANNTQQLQQAMAQLQEFINELRLNIGILQAQRQEQKTAFSTWNEVNLQPNHPTQSESARALIGLWSQPPQVLPNTEGLVKQTLNGWFQLRALERFYQIKEQQNDLAQLRSQEKQLAQRAVVKLALIGGVPFIGGVIGVGILLVLLTQLFIQKERSLLAINATWETPWNWEVVWQVLIVGFFFISQILLPLMFTLLGFNPTGLSLRLKAVYILVSYLLVAAGGLSVLYISLKPFFPLPSHWFRLQGQGKWILWGIGGYLVALPLVVIVSLVNQRIWQGQGGSNPLLFLALQAQDRVALAIFFFTASVAAPLFEEIIFRGFLLPSLTRYLPVWGAIVVSSFVFALAHLSLSEVLPLAVLGIVLAVVYARSNNLLSSILLHSLWNSGTLLSLFILGSGS